VHAQLLANAGAELNAFLTWADEFYLRSHHRSAALLDPATIDTPRIQWNTHQAETAPHLSPARPTAHG
jgi:NADH dehydrogenase